MAGSSAERTVGEFHTAAAPASGNGVRTSSVLGDRKTYGEAMPIILKLSTSLSSNEQRAAFERTLSVKATPATSGAWGWINGKELHFRPKEFWAAGSKVHVSVDAAGRTLGAGKWGRNDMTLDFTIGDRREMRANSATHMMDVVENGKVVRTMPVSLGKPKYPSSSGTMVVIEKAPKAMFDSSTYGLPVDSKDGYRTEVEFPIRFTWGGQFIHSAPWSVRQQGHTNTSHGCINVAPANAKWLFDRIQIGDPVIVSNTETKIGWADGWMEWSMSFAQWTQHSATGEVTAG
jgi:lipoprotein-anchoring transpeptidase ErfK/SrfK